MENEDILNVEETLNELFEEEKEAELSHEDNKEKETEESESVLEEESEDVKLKENSDSEEKLDVEDSEENEKEQIEINEAMHLSNEYFEHLLKLQAEFDNFRKRTDGDIKKAYQSGFTDAIMGFLPAIDSFKMAKEYITDKNTLVGIEFIEKGILDTLSKMGVTAIDCSGKFDPNFHQAIGSEEAEDFESGDIIKECFKGFVYGDKVIRYSQVIVKK